MDGGDAEVARVRTAARGFHPPRTDRSDHRHPVQSQRLTRSQAGKGGIEEAGEAAVRAMRHDPSAAAERQTRESRRARRATRARPVRRRPSSGSPTNMPSTAGARSIDVQRRAGGVRRRNRTAARRSGALSCCHGRRRRRRASASCSGRRSSVGWKPSRVEPRRSGSVDRLCRVAVRSTSRTSQPRSRSSAAAERAACRAAWWCRGPPRAPGSGPGG